MQSNAIDCNQFQFLWCMNTANLVQIVSDYLSHESIDFSFTFRHIVQRISGTPSMLTLETSFSVVYRIQITFCHVYSVDNVDLICYFIPVSTWPEIIGAITIRICRFLLYLVWQLRFHFFLQTPQQERTQHFVQTADNE